MNMLLAFELLSLALFVFVLSLEERVLTKNVIDIYLDLDKAILLKSKILFPVSPSFSTKNLKHQQFVPSNNKELTIRATLAGIFQPSNSTAYLGLSAWNGRGHDWGLMGFLVPT